jgi:hypothetical protein
VATKFSDNIPGAATVDRAVVEVRNRTGAFKTAAARRGTATLALYPRKRDVEADILADRAAGTLASIEVSAAGSVDPSEAVGAAVLPLQSQFEDVAVVWPEPDPAA